MNTEVVIGKLKQLDKLFLYHTKVKIKQSLQYNNKVHQQYKSYKKHSTDKQKT